MEKREISIRDELYQQLEKAFSEAGFSSVEAYVEFILEEVLKKENDQEEKDYSPEEEEKIQKRLQDLGYID